MRKAHLFAAVAALSLVGSAQAYTINILPMPDNLIAFDGHEGETGNVNVSGLGDFTGDVTVYPNGVSVPNLAAAPPGDGAYLSIGGVSGGSATLATVGGPYRALDLEWGSIDTYNSLTIDPLHGAPITITGSQIMSMIPGGEWGSTSAFVQILGLPRYKDVSFASDGQAAFEVQFSGTPCPEPATWALMLVGFAGLGYAARQRRTHLARVAA
jgi:hypothetical protein